MSKTDSADPGIYTSWILCGGTKSFEIFLRTLAGEQIRLHSYSSIQEIPFEELRSTVIFLLPEYEKGVESIRELPFETAEKILACLERDNSLYMENYLAQDYFHRSLEANGLFIRNIWNTNKLSFRHGNPFICRQSPQNQRFLQQFRIAPEPTGSSGKAGQVTRFWCSIRQKGSSAVPWIFPGWTCTSCGLIRAGVNCTGICFQQ